MRKTKTATTKKQTIVKVEAEGNIELRLEGIEEELKKITRRQDNLQKELTLLSSEREILEDIIGSLQHLKEVIIQNQQHQDIQRDSLVADVKVVAGNTEDLQKSLDDHTIVVSSKNQGLLNKLTKIFKKEVK